MSETVYHSPRPCDFFMLPHIKYGRPPEDHLQRSRSAEGGRHDMDATVYGFGMHSSNPNRPWGVGIYQAASQLASHGAFNCQGRC